MTSHSSHRTETLGNVVDGVVSGAGKLVAPVAKVVGKGISKVKFGIKKSPSLAKKDFSMFPSPKLHSPELEGNNHLIHVKSDIYWASSDSYSRRYDNYNYSYNNYKENSANQNDDMDKENTKPKLKKIKKKNYKIRTSNYENSNGLNTIKKPNKNNINGTRNLRKKQKTLLDLNSKSNEQPNNNNDDILDLVFSDITHSNNNTIQAKIEKPKPVNPKKKSKKPFGGQKTILAMIDPTKLKRSSKSPIKTKQFSGTNNNKNIFSPSNNNFKDFSTQNTNSSVNNWVTFDNDKNDKFESDSFTDFTSNNPFNNKNNSDINTAKSISNTQSNWVTF